MGGWIDRYVGICIDGCIDWQVNGQMMGKGISSRVGNREGHNQLSGPIWDRKAILRKTWPFELSLQNNMRAHWDRIKAEHTKGGAEGTEVGEHLDGARPLRSSSLSLAGGAQDREWGLTALFLRSPWTPGGILTDRDCPSCPLQGAGVSLPPC